MLMKIHNFSFTKMLLNISYVKWWPFCPGGNKLITLRCGHVLGTMLRYNLMTSSNVNISALLALCARNSPVTGEFPSQRPVTRSFDVSLICALNKRLGWVNNREAGDLRLRAHYDVTVMFFYRHRYEFWNVPFTSDRAAVFWQTASFSWWLCHLWHECR